MSDVSIAGAAKRSGLSARQIRYLEDRGFIAPDWISVGNGQQRRYSEALVNRLAEINKLRQRGFELATAVALASK